MDDRDATRVALPPRAPLDLVEEAGRRHDVYRQQDREGVAVVDGFGTKIIVERGHLELHDGVGPDRRLRRYPKIDPPRRVVVGIGTVGMISMDAVRWCSRVGTPLVVLGADGPLLAAGPPGREDARLLRAQALALYGPVGVEVSRYLLGEKIRGQAQVLRAHFGEEDATSTIDDLYGSMAGVDTIEGLRQVEAAAANVYFATFERRVEVVFNRKDAARIPGHWERFNGRRSAVNPASPRHASDVAGATLNYCYKLAEIEAAMAARVMGLNPGIGILHADLPGRPSFACDLMEAIRPNVDAHVLEILAGPLRKREFTEDARGVVRCLAPLTHRLAEAMPAYGVALAPVVEHVAELLAESSPYDVAVPTKLSGSKHKAAARKRAGRSGTAKPAKVSGPNPGILAPRGQRRSKPSLSPPLPLRSCRGCGAELPPDEDRDRPRIDWCPECLQSRRKELGRGLNSASQTTAQRFQHRTGMRPTHTPSAKEARVAGNMRQREEERRWAASGGGQVELAWYQRAVWPKLAGISLPTIARATGASTAAASKWRAGRTTPHPRHWSALAALVKSLDAHPYEGS